MPAILVINGDSHAIAAIDAVLKRKRFDVVVAPDGRAGLDLFKAEKFDAVVTAILMPEWTGLRPSGNCAALIRRSRSSRCRAAHSRTRRTVRRISSALRSSSTPVAECVMIGFLSANEGKSARTA